MPLRNLHPTWLTGASAESRLHARGVHERRGWKMRSLALRLLSAAFSVTLIWPGVTAASWAIDTSQLPLPEASTVQPTSRLPWQHQLHGGTRRNLGGDADPAAILRQARRGQGEIGRGSAIRRCSEDRRDARRTAALSSPSSCPKEQARETCEGEGRLVFVFRRILLNLHGARGCRRRPLTRRP